MHSVDGYRRSNNHDHTWVHINCSGVFILIVYKTIILWYKGEDTMELRTIIETANSGTILDDFSLLEVPLINQQKEVYFS